MSTAILITGASSGFGRAAAETLARRGYMVFATMRDTLGRNARNREALDSLTLRERLALETLDMDVNDDNSVDQRSVRRSTGPDTLTSSSTMPDSRISASPRLTPSTRSSRFSIPMFWEQSA
jgi:GDP-D-mannose dehydratase